MPPKVAVINYNATWCGHSKRLQPTWDKLQQDLREHPFIDVIDMKCDGGPEKQAVCQAMGIQGFPTVLMKRPDGVILEYRGDRSLGDLKKWIETSLKVQAPPDSSSPVV